MKTILALTLFACAVLPAQETPAPTELPASPFVIKDTWFIGGAGNWDYLTMDSQSSRLFIAHGPVVQVVDTETGNLAGQITGLRFAHSIALDDSGEVGFVSDGPANQVAIFERRTFKIVARVTTGANPRAWYSNPRAICSSLSAPTCCRKTHPHRGPPISPNPRSPLSTRRREPQSPPSFSPAGWVSPPPTPLAKSTLASLTTMKSPGSM